MRAARRIPSGLLPAALGLALACVPSVATAHVEVVSSTPAAGDRLETAPGEVIISFDGELDPTDSGFTVVDGHGEEVGDGEVDLNVADRNVLRGEVAITEPGVYTVEYSVLGADGHRIEGSFSFGYATDEDVPAGETGEDGEGHGPPDTALRAPGPPAATAAGLMLLLMAGIIAFRRAARVATAGFVIPALAVSALAACVPGTTLPDSCDADRVGLSATLVEERLEPSTLEVCRGQEVTIEFTIERDAILHLHGYDDQVPAQEVRTGETVTFTFDASQAGEFPIEIHTSDGPAEATVGTLVVHEP